MIGRLRVTRHFFFFSLFSLLVLLVAILAPSKALLRLSSIAGHFRLQAQKHLPSLHRRSLVTSTMAAKAYQNPPQAPPLFTATPESILANTVKITAQSKSVLDKIVADVKAENATFATVQEPILLDDNEQEAPQRILTFFNYVSTDKALRDASAKAREMFSDAYIESKMKEDVFKLVNAAYATRGSQNLEEEQLIILEKERKKYIKNGLLLPPGEKRDRFKEIQKRISLLAIEAQKNLNEESGGYWCKPEELEGVPKDDIDPDTLEKGTGENEGKVKVTFKYNHYTPTIRYAKSEKVRREYIIADSNKNNNNVPLFKEILQLRDEAARLLGYADHASVQIEDKMAKSPKTVNEFLGDLRTRLVPGSEKELEKLVEYKKRDCEERGVPYKDFYLWDTAYYSRLIKEKEYSVDEVEISQYFPAESTFAGMLKIFEQIFGFVFVELSKEDRARLSPTGRSEDIAWHEDVIIYSVWDDEASGGGFCGYLYLDLFPRDNKYGHYANFGVEAGYKARDGSKKYPSTALVCNFSKPTATKPSLLKHHEVVTFFHELGHGIHDLSARTHYSFTHGTAVKSDFVEAPSQMLENWCWTPNVLKSLSKHWETGEQIPDDLIEKLVKTKHFNEATNEMNQILIGTFDMTIHSPKSHDEVKDMDYGTLWNTLRHDITGIKGPEDVGEGINWGNRYASIGHFIGGYDAGYYGYLYSKVFSLDMFHAAFKANPMDGVQGRRYRHTVLERGGSKSEMEFLKEFLGRDPSSDAFYAELGLSK